MSNPHRQVGLRHGTVEAVCNLPDDRRLRPGTRLTLKDHEMGDVLWTVAWTSNQVNDKANLRTTARWTTALRRA